MSASLDSLLGDFSSRSGNYWLFILLSTVPGLIGGVLLLYGLWSQNLLITTTGPTLWLVYVPIYVLWKGMQRSTRRLQQVRMNTRAMLDSDDDLIIQHNFDGHIIGANMTASRMLGYNRDELQSLSFWALDESQVLKQHPEYQAQLANGGAIHYQTEFRTREGETFPVEIRTRLADWLQHPRLISVARDISEWRNTERALEASRKSLERARNRLETRVHQRARELKRQIDGREQAEKDVNDLREFLYAMIDSMPSVIIALDKKQRVTQWNHQTEVMVGISAEEATGQSLGDIIPEFRPHIAKISDTLSIKHYPYRDRIEGKISGKNYILDLMIYTLSSVASEGVVVRVDDVTEKVKLENMLLQTEKMLSLGGLAAGMAHEINNPLGAILQSSQNLRRRLTFDLTRNKNIAEKLELSTKSFDKYMVEQKIDYFLNTIDEAGKRAAIIVEDMLSFSRPAGMEKQKLDMEEIIEASVRLAQNDFSAKKKYDFRNISIIRDYASDIPLVLGRRTRLQQVLLNLLTNAAQALAVPEIKSPSISLRLFFDLNQVVLEFIDNGQGMSEQVSRRIFEPFFTTKSEGSGTGLGLSVSYFIITEQMKGSMEVHSQPGAGTRFVIRLPVAEIEPDQPDRAEIPQTGQQFELLLPK